MEPLQFTDENLLSLQRMKIKRMLEGLTNKLNTSFASVATNNTRSASSFSRELAAKDKEIAEKERAKELMSQIEEN